MVHPIFISWKNWPRARAELATMLDDDSLTLVETAFDLAETWQAGQRRPGGEPNTEHLLEVLEILTRGAGERDGEVLAAAAAHDVIEDSACTLDVLERALGPGPGRLVALLTDPEPRPGESPADTRLRYLRGISTGPGEAIRIKLADRYSNVQRLHLHPDPAWRRRYYAETCEHIVPLAAAHPWFARCFDSWRRHYSSSLEA
ncbi:GTP pyrophosphokinase [Nonomuraea solani]|uniref:GTP pyrophosphokinase n=2 Tax=Nonomuraea solani TaxID=1144553 RepID=A0A1H6EQW4_9ACTN|nr:GTP pyrophosphokinase [Nonomuraea solani]